MAGAYNDLGTVGLEAGFGYDGNFFTQSNVQGLTAKASGTQANATQLTCMVNQVTTVASVGDAVKLPGGRPTLVGVEILVVNDAVNAMQVFGSGNDTINNAAAAVGVAQMGGSAVYYVLKSFNPNTNVGAWVASGIGAGYASGSFQTYSTQNNITASSTQTQAAGTPIVGSQAQIATCAVSGNAVTLPPAQPGMELTIINNGAQPCNVFPASQTQGGVSGGDRILPGAQNAAFSLVVTTPTIFFCFLQGSWVTK